MLTQSGLRLGVGLPQVFPDGRADTGLIREFAVRAEALGYEDLWLTDNTLGGRMLIEPVTLLAFAAACTQRIRLGVSVIILNQRNPVVLAKALASLDQLSGGRVTAGVGLGRVTAAYSAFGISEDRPVARFTDGIRLLRVLWNEERVTFRGDFFQLEDVSLQPKPVQKPHLPLWIGGHAPTALRRAVRYGDGWMGAGASSTQEFLEDIPQVLAYLKERGRDETSFALSKRVYIAVDASEERARERLALGLTQQYGSAQLAGRAGVAGTPKQVVEVLRSMRDAGLHHLLLHPFGDSLQQLEMLSSEVAPAL
jgi:probable F420-dependent oxidoreductase